jgi:hypothetical protein
VSDHGRQHDLRSLVRGVFRERAQEPMLTLNLLRQHWSQVVGEELAAQIRPQRLASGTLWIAAADACWAYELQFFKAELLASVQAFLESRGVNDLRFRAAPAEFVASAPGDDDALAEPQEEGPRALELPDAHSLRTLAQAATRSTAWTSGGDSVGEGQVAEPPAAFEAPPALAQAAGAIGDAALRAVFQRSLAKQRLSRQRREDAEHAETQRPARGSDTP